MKLNFTLNKLKPGIMGPMKHRLIKAKKTLDCFPDNKHWYCGGFRTAAVAASLLLENKIIALPTDTIYGFAGLAQCNKTIERLYEIKKRDLKKPLSICLSDINDIGKWAEVQDLPQNLIEYLLPGPITIVLKRKQTLNPLLNEGIENIGIRVPNSNFVLSVVKLVNQPIALTSANLSQNESTLHPTEFEDLWPKLDGIFYNKISVSTKKFSRKGSSVIDLSVKGEFKILRKGDNYTQIERILTYFNIKKQGNDEKENKEGKCKEKDPEDIENVKDCASD